MRASAALPDAVLLFLPRTQPDPGTALAAGVVAEHSFELENIKHHALAKGDLSRNFAPDCVQTLARALEDGDQIGWFAVVLESVEADANIADVAILFIQREYKHFPVMQENQLVGQISRRDVLKALEQLRHEAQ